VTSIWGGTLQLGDGTSGHNGSVNNSSSISISAAAILKYLEYGNFAAAQQITGSGLVTNAGSGQLDYRGQHTGFSGTYSGNILW
jgi:hypothetical protein